MLQIDALTYRIAGRPLLEDASATVNRGELVVLLGRSGSGKSTLLNLLSGIDLPSSGEVVVRGEAVQEKGPVGHLRSHGAELRYLAIRLIPIPERLQGL